MILFVNGCMREHSRTLQLAQEVLKKAQDEVQEVCLDKENFQGLSADTLSLREALLAEKNYGHPMFRWAKQFAEADTIVIAAPYWDLLFPAKVRAYLEEITVSGITFRYTPEGRPQGLCKATRLIYVTTAGGPIFKNFGFEYIEAMAQAFFGISDVRLVKAEGLDIWGNDPDAILEQAKREIAAMN